MIKKTRVLNYSIFLSLLVVFISCSASQITVNEAKLKKISSIAILPIDRAKGIPLSAAIESEEAFKSCFIQSGISIVERKKLAEILKEDELKMMLPKYSDEMASLTGADALLIGQITQYCESISDIEYMGYDKDEMGFDITHKVDEKNNKDIKLEKKKIKDKSHDLNFKILIRLVSVSDGETILVMENSLSTKSFKESEGNVFKTSLDRFKNDILDMMSSDLKKVLTSNRK